MMYLFCFLNVCNLVIYKPQCISFNCINLTACICNVQRMKTMSSEVKRGPEGVSLHGKDALQLLPQKLQEKLMPFQREGVCFALSMDGRSVNFLLYILIYAFCFVFAHNTFFHLAILYFSLLQLYQYQYTTN